MDHIASLLAGSVWTIVPEKLALIRDVLRLRAAGVRLSEAEIKHRLGLSAEDDFPPPPKPTRQGATAVLPIYGFLCPKANMVTQFSGGTSLESFTRNLRAASSDPAVSSIVLDIDSPGGIWTGVEEAWSAIYTARKAKPVEAMVSPSAGSGAYCLATAAERITLTPSGEVGSVGAFTIHEDHSGELEKAGVSVDLIVAKGSPYKAEGNPFGPLSEEARAHSQALVDQVLVSFQGLVAKGRGVSAADVRKNYGQGRMLMAKDALAAGMVDRLGTMDDTLARVTGRRASGVRAEVETAPVLAVADLESDPAYWRGIWAEIGD